MGLLTKKDKGTSSKTMSRLSGGSGSQLSALRPRYVESLPPCTGNCPSGNDIRGWLTVISLREKPVSRRGVSRWRPTPSRR
jgi:hypothetical protein